MKTWEEISSLMYQRRQQDAPFLRQMVEARDRYNGDMALPFPDVQGEPTMSSLSPQIVADGIDHTAMRAASVMPAISCPALGSGPRAKDYAVSRRKALYANWHYCGMDLLLYRYFRHFIGYGTACLVVVPNFHEERAQVEVRDPLTAYPELRTPEDFRQPLNVGFVYGRTFSWINKNYPESSGRLKATNDDTLWDLVEWIDEDHVVIGVLGPRSTTYYNSGGADPYYASMSPHGNSMQLRRWDNRTGFVPAAVPRRATLDRIMGQLTHIFPAIDWLEKLTALTMISAERSTFPDLVILGKKTAAPLIQGGTWKDGRTGEPNVVLDADGVTLLNTQASQASLQAREYLERTARVSGGVIPQFGGENQPGLRTGRALDAMGGFSIDPRIMEAQKFAQRALSTVNEAIMATEKGYWPNKKFSVYSGWANDSDLVEYVPSRDFKVLENSVHYAIPGTDVTTITVALNQLVGGDLLSKGSARSQHPFINDSESESKAILHERIEEAMMVTFLQRATVGAIPLIDLATIDKVYMKTGSMIEAVMQADELARNRQAALAPPPGAGEAVSPATQPGLALPGEGAESQPVAAMAANGPAQVEQLIAALRGQPRSSQVITSNR